MSPALSLPNAVAHRENLAFRATSAAYQRMLESLERFARDPNVPVLLEGESGTGKTVLAKHLHLQSPRARSPYQHVVLAALDDGLAGSELFGHVAGAFTDARYSRAGHFVSANGGTIVLDEIGKASRAVQQKLLHAIEYGEIRPIGADREIRVDVRVVAASNVPLGDAAARGDFLPDLLARISVFRICVPPLRERRADIPQLARHCLQWHAQSASRTPPEIDADLLRALQVAPWPNNLRQLDATMHRLLIESDGDDVVTPHHCRGDLLYLRQLAGKPLELTAPTVDEAIASAGSVAGAARLLGVDRTTVHRFQRRRLEG